MAYGTRLLHCLLTLTIALSATAAWAGLYDPPASYYAGATGTGATLKGQLTTAMSTGHIQRTYGDFRFSAAWHDADPNTLILDDDPNTPEINPNIAARKILLMYNRASVSAAWDNGTTWNREHVWPVSLQGGSDPSSGTIGNRADPHALRPANPGINSSRGNKPFGLDTTTGSYGAVPSTNYYYPGDADKGDAARELFYSDTRWSSLGLTLVDTAPGAFQMGDRSSLIAWHYLDPPDEFEIRRNHTIYSQKLNPTYYTNNRNAYVDRPEYVWSVYMDQLNDSQLYVGAGPDPNGASSANLNLGSVLVGSSVPAAQNVTLNRVGVDGVYYEVTTTGDATSSVTGRHNAFKINTVPTDSRTLSIGLDPNADTSSAGAINGAVTVNNLDITTGGGAGRGARDQNDTINVSLSVLDHANPSFLVGSDENVWTIDFGTVTLGATLPTTDFTLANLVATTGFTAKLDFDSFSSSGDDNVLTTNLATFTGGSALAAGFSNLFTATLDTANVGNFAATYTLNFSDENLVGATSLGSLTLNLLGEIIAAADNADFNDDDFVDGKDFLIWQTGFGIGTTLEDGDANGDGEVNGEDLVIWEAQYGPVPPLAGLATVPEPTALTLAALMGLAATARIRRTRA